MVLRVRSAVGVRLGRWQPMRRWLLARRALVAGLGSIILVILITVYGSAGRWRSVEFSLPQGWAVGALVFRAWTRARVPDGRLARAAKWAMWSTWPALCLQQFAYALDGQRWDAVVLAGWLTLLIGLESAVEAPLKARQALRRLRNRGVLDVRPGELSGLGRQLKRTGDRWALVGGWCTAIALMVTWPRAADFGSQWDSWAFGPAATDQIQVVAAGAIAGAWLGRMAGYGRLSGVLTRRRLPMRIVPSHADGAAGLKPVGDFYLYQSLVAGLPAIFLAGWVLLVSLGRANRTVHHYVPYLYQYVWLLALAIVFEVAVFIVPMYSMHRLMKQQKQAVFLPEADRLSTVIEAARVTLTEEDTKDHDAITRRITQLVERCESLEKTPTWPIDASIRRRFTWRNLGLLVPFLGYVVGPTPLWKQISDLIAGLG